ncbi:phosphoadenosine phosphosulfate reductase [Azospirillum thiophilum]|uniref:Phosphoadenosine phosphosulfate reductase n=1 Tax=Azospirillum thiophilum TaxID=528244 RepID=A0AAC9EYQ6_9PROT|nr:phosphoadenosine phosphosulfate reductase family protein [Azospirillum thiophilum]ALG75176.1 phosphoadenosine phosphosulfate reductase [Azospirillum thiophilum]KJR62570.1 phosphoadenosine phosphosulfate reductase [Azospirillum thiophilum]
MSKLQATLWDSERLHKADAIDLTVQSLLAHGADHAHWGIAWSGGKDSSATLTLLVHLLDTGRIHRPRSLTVFYADTRQELPPLAIAAQRIMDQLRSRGITVRVVTAPLEKRFLVYILGRGVPPPNNNTLRWCTRQIKVDPMTAAIEQQINAVDGTFLMITGVRLGESAARDQRIALSCGKDGGECGQGWYQQVLPNAKGIRGRIATLAPLLHWRVCHVWEWLMFDAHAAGWATADIADAYGGDEAEEINARTGCTGCPLAQKELALESSLRSAKWAYLSPLEGLKPLYRELRLPKHRLKKTGLNADGTIATAKNRQRMGPLTFEARLMGLDRILSIQAAVNEAAAQIGRPVIDMLNPEEENRIRELIAAGTWPNGWDGDEPTGDVPQDMIYGDGAVQPLLVR